MKTSLNLFIILTLTFAACSPKDKEEANVKVRTIPVRVEQVEEKSMSISIESHGRLSAGKESQMSFKISGIVDRIYVEEGQQVRKGQLLASLDLIEINAQVNQAQVAYEKAERDLKRAQNLHKDEVITLETLQNAETGFEVAKADLEIAQFNKRFATIKAPADGHILTQYVEENELVNPGNPVFRFADANESWIMTTGLIDRDIVNVREGDRAVVEFDAYPGTEFEAYVDLIPSESNQMNGTYEVEIKLKYTVKGLRSGFYGDVKIFPAKQKEYKIVPMISVVEGNGRDAFIYEPQGEEVQKTPVIVEEFLGDYLAISSNDVAIDYVITDGVNYLNENSRIEVIR